MDETSKIMVRGERQELFRPEAVEHMRRRLEGEVVLSSSPQTKLFTWLFVLIVLAATVAAFAASYARRETVPGWIVPNEGLIRLSPRQVGTLTQLVVQEGDSVEAGDIVARLTVGNSLEEGMQAKATIGAVAEEAAAVASQASVARAQIGAERRRLALQRSGLQRELNQARVQVALLHRQLDLAREELSRGQKLAERGFLSQANLDRLRAAELAAEGQVSQAETAVLSTARQLEDLQQMEAQAALDLANVEAQAAQTRATLEQKRISAEALGANVINAPIAGTVAATPVQVGQTVSPGQTVAVLAPSDSRLIAELYVPSRAVGFLEVGQEVRLMYQAFPHQKFGVGVGRIEEVSQTVLAANELAIPGIQVQEPVFRVRARLRDHNVSAYGERIALRPGMLLSADVVIDRRTLIEWLLDPLYASGRR